MGSQDPGIYANTRIWGHRSRNVWYPTAQGRSNVRTRVGVGMDGQLVLIVRSRVCCFVITYVGSSN